MTANALLTKAPAFELKNTQKLYKFLLENLSASERTSSQLAIRNSKRKFLVSPPKQHDESQSDEQVKSTLSSEEFFEAQCFANYLHEMNNYKKMISQYRMPSNTSVTDQMRRMSQENFVNRLKKGSFKNIAHEISQAKQESGEASFSEGIYKDEMDRMKESIDTEDLEIGKDKI